MTAKTQLEKYPFTSADSTTWLLNASYGNLSFGDIKIVVSDRQTDNPLFYKNLGEDLIQRFEAKVVERGLDLERLLTSGAYRCKWEAHELLDWVNNYEYKGRKKFQKRLF